MPRTLKISFPEKCVGCEMCILEAQRQLSKVGLEGALIRVFRNTNSKLGNIEYSLEIDPRINSLNVDKIAQICPKLVFEVEEAE
ncbi:MAG: hypothetical protein KatS3mg101_0001 [Patescibacteria group bacterium]|nr:MAG: hypothetical protein KatS3mg101_0001 [Patescibacteria group bacterium]